MIFSSKNLKYLSITNCSMIVSPFSKFNRITDLYINNCPNFNPKSLTKLNNILQNIDTSIIIKDVGGKVKTKKTFRKRINKTFK